MELRTRAFTISLLLALLLFTHSCSSFHGNGGLFSDSGTDAAEEVYEIDYRGPETHSYFPPPHVGQNPHTGPHSIDRKNRHVGGNRKQIRG